MNYNILAYNLFLGEKEEQIKYINDNNFDIIFLSEASSNVIDNFNNYIGDKIDSHCGYTYLGIHKKHNIDILMIIKLIGCVVFHVKINNKEFILGSLHLFPYKENKNKRKEQLNRIYEDLEDNNLLHLPIILGGDTNMGDNENYIESYDFIDIDNDNYNYTYPNRKCKDPRITFIPKNNFKYDKFLIKNCTASDFKTIPNNSSDHLAISINIKI
jgi:hypothetical protein